MRVCVCVGEKEREREREKERENSLLHLHQVGATKKVCVTKVSFCGRNYLIRKHVVEAIRAD